MKRIFLILLVAVFTASGFGQTILKKVNVDIPALEKTAIVAEVTFIAKDQSYVKANLYERAKRVKTEIVDLDGTIYETEIGRFVPINMLAENRTFNQSDAISVLGLTAADYLVFYPKVVELTPEQIKAARIAELEKVIATATTELNELKK